MTIVEKEPLSIPVLCLVCTPPSTGCQLVATLTLKLSAKLSEVRSAILDLSTGADAPRLHEEELANASPSDLAVWSKTPLHPFDFTKSFRFIRHSSRVISLEGEKKASLRSSFPRYPRKVWTHLERSSEGSKPWRFSQQFTPPTVALHVAGTRREVLALCVVFVSHVEPIEKSAGEEGLSSSRLIPEPVVMERLSLSPFPSSFGEVFTCDALWTKNVNKWNINVRDYMGYTLLHESVICGEEAGFFHLVSHPYIDVDATDYQGNTALHFAVRYSLGTIFVERLLRAGANPLLKNNNGNTALHLAFAHRRGAAQGLLCAAIRKSFSEEKKGTIGDILNLTNNVGFSVRDMFLGSVSFIELLQKGSWEGVHAYITHFLFEIDKARHCLMCFNEKSALHVAVEAENLEAVTYLLSSSPKDLIWTTDNRQQTPLHVAAACGNLELIALLSKTFPAFLSAIDIGSNTPLMVAVKKKRAHAVDFMLNSFSPELLLVHHCDTERFNALQLLCGEGYFRLADLFVTRFGVSIPSSTEEHKFGWKQGVDGVVFNKGLVLTETPKANKLMQHFSKRLSRRLRKTSPSLFAQDGILFRESYSTESLFFTVVRRALQQPLFDVTEFLVKLARGGAIQTFEDVMNFFIYMVTSRHTELASEALTRSEVFGLPIKLVERLRHCNCLLCFFCRRCDRCGIRWCVESHVGDLNAPVELESESPLHVSIIAGDAATVQFLLEHGADANLILTTTGRATGRGNGACPLSAAITHSSTHQDAIVKALVQGGSRLLYTEPDSSQWSALELAAKCFNENVVKGLLGFSSETGATYALRTTLLQAVHYSSLHRKNSSTKFSTKHKVLERICESLAMHFDPLRSAAHPYELLCLATNAGFFGVATQLSECLVAHAKRTEILKDVPTSPPPRSQTEIVPKPALPMEGITQKSQLRRLLYAPRKVSFTRWRREAPFKTSFILSKLTGELQHRILRRDAFSFAAEAGNNDLLNTLFQLGLSPWLGGDRDRGWSPADYALHRKRKETYSILLLHGVYPLREHPEAPHMLSSLHFGALLRAGLSLQRMLMSKPLLPSDPLLAAELIYALINNDAPNDVLLCFLKEFSFCSSVWLGTVTEKCVRRRRLSVLKFLVEELQLSFVGATSALSNAALFNLEEYTAYLVLHGCSPLSTSMVSIEAVEIWPETSLTRRWDTFSPLFLASYFGSTSAMEIMTHFLNGSDHHGRSAMKAETCLNDDRVGRDALSALSARIARHAFCPYMEDQGIKMIRLLHRAGHPYLSNELAVKAVRLGYYSLLSTLLTCYGEEVVLTELDMLAVTSQKLRHNGVLYGASKSPAVAAALESMLSNHETCKRRVMEMANELVARQSAEAISEEASIANHFSLVDESLGSNCPSAAVMLWTLGFRGRSQGPSLKRQSSTLCLQIAAAQRLYYSHQVEKAHKQETQCSYTLLHSAAQLGYVEVLSLVLEKHMTLQVPLPVFQSNVNGACAPCSLFSLSLRHPPACRDALLAKLFQAFQPNFMEDCLTTNDIISAIVAGLRVLPELQRIFRFQSAEKKYELLMSSVPVVTSHQHCISRYGRLRQGTPLAVAIAESSLEWTQFLLNCATEWKCNQSNLKKWKEEKVCVDWICKRRKIMTADGATHHMSHTTEVHQHHFSVLVWAAAVLADTHSSGNRNRFKDCEKIFLTLLRSHMFHLVPSEFNAVSIALCSLRLWDLVAAMVQHAEAVSFRNQSASSTSGLYFFPIQTTDIPVVLSRTVGPFRYIMHALAVGATCKERVTAMARHCERLDIEQSMDACGRSCLYLALQGRLGRVRPDYTRGTRAAARSLTVFEAFAALKLPLSAVCCDRTKRTLLHVAAAEGDEILMKKLLKYASAHEAGVDERDFQGVTPLMLAAKIGCMQLVELLIAAKANPRARDIRGYTAAMHSALYGYDEVALQLATVFDGSQDGMEEEQRVTLLHCTAVGGCWKTCQAVLQKRRNAYELLYVTDPSGATPLTLARGFGHGSVVRQLISAQSNALLSSETSITATQLMQKANRTDQRVLRCDALLPRYGWLRGALVIGEVIQKQAARQLKQQQPLPWEDRYRKGSHQLNHRWSDTCSLKWCVENQYAVGVRALADLNVADTCYALHVAALVGSKEMIDLLLSLNMSNPSVQATRYQIKRYGKRKHKEMDEIYMQRENNELFFPFEVAAMAGHEDCALLLLGVTPDSTLQKIFEAECRKAARQGSIFYTLSISCRGVILKALVKRMCCLKISSTPDMPAALYALLHREDVSGMTSLELTVAMGETEAFLRCVELMHELEKNQASCSSDPYNSAKTTVLFSPALLHFIPSLTPSLRVVLFDVLDMVDASRTVGFQKQKKSIRRHGRLSFGDVRLIGIEALRRNKLCASCTATVFTPEHERVVLGYTLRKVRQKIRFEPGGFEKLSAADQSRHLQWLGSSVVLAAYKKLSTKEVKYIHVCVGDCSKDPTIQFQGQSLYHSLSCTAKGTLVIVSARDKHPSFYASKRKKWDQQLTEMRRETRRQLQQLPHPCFRSAEVRIDWDILQTPMRGETVQEDTVHWESAIRRLRDSMKRVADALEFRVPTAVNEISMDELEMVRNSLGESRHSHFTLNYVFAPSGVTTAVNQETIIFTESGVGEETAAVTSWLQVVCCDTTLARVSRERDEFLKAVAVVLRRRRGEKIGISFDLELEGVNAAQVPPLHFQSALRNILEAVRVMLAPPSHSAAPFVFAAMSRIQRQFKKRFSRVTVRLSARKVPIAVYDAEGGVLMVTISLDGAPRADEVADEMRDAAVQLSLQSSQLQVSVAVQEALLQLRTYMPTASLHVDFGRLHKRKCEKDGELPAEWLDLLIANHVLLQHHGVLVLRPLVESLGTGWDTSFGSALRRQVGEVVVQFTKEEWSCLRISAKDHRCTYVLSLRSDETKFGGEGILRKEAIRNMLVNALRELEPQAVTEWERSTREKKEKTKKKNKRKKKNHSHWR